MADAANHPVPSIAATGVAGGSYLTPAEGLWKCVQHLRCNIAVLEERCAQKETVQKSTQHKLDRACRRHQSDEATMRRLESRLEAPKQNLTYVRCPAHHDPYVFSPYGHCHDVGAVIRWGAGGAAWMLSDRPRGAAKPSPVGRCAV